MNPHIFDPFKMRKERSLFWLKFLLGAFVYGAATYLVFVLMAFAVFVEAGALSSGTSTLKAEIYGWSAVMLAILLILVGLVFLWRVGKLFREFIIGFLTKLAIFCAWVNFVVAPMLALISQASILNNRVIIV